MKKLLITIGAVAALLIVFISINHYSTAYMKQASDTPIKNLNEDVLQTLVGQKVTLVGTAEDGKIYPALMGESGGMIYITGHVRWPSEYMHKKVSVTGTLRFYKYEPSPNDDGIPVQEIFGDYYSISRDSWSLVE